MPIKRGFSHPETIVNALSCLELRHGVTFEKTEGEHSKLILKNDKFRVFAYIDKRDEYSALRSCVFEMCELLDDYTAMSAIN